MKYFYLTVICMMMLIRTSNAQLVITQQSFENETIDWGYSCSPVPYTLADSYWNILTTEVALSNMPSAGSHFFGVKDLNSPSGTADWGVLHFQEVDLSSYQSVFLQFNYEAVGYDSGDDIKYQLKLNSYLQPEVLLVDGYNNLTINGLASISIPDTVQTLEFMISVKQNGTTDFAAFDNFTLVGEENIILNEPSNYPTNLHAETSTPTSIAIAWEENQGLDPASYYLLIISTSPISLIPTDHTPIPSDLIFQDGYGVVNLSAGTGSYTFNGLTPSTEYHFCIYPYSNTGQNCDYKTDEIPPGLSTTTFVLSSIFLSEISDPADLTSARFVEIHNASDDDLSFQNGNWNLCKQTNGSTWTCVALTGTIQSNKSYVVAYSQASYQTAYHSLPSQSSSSVVTGNGNDAYFLFYGGNYLSGQLVDQYGTLNTDGVGTNWDYTDSKTVRKLTATSGTANFLASDWRTHSANAADCHPGFYGTIFTGNNSAVWEDSLNWENGIPFTGHTAWIMNSAGNFPVVTQSTNIGSLILEDEIELIGHQLLAVSDKTTIGVKVPAYTPESDRWFLLAAPVAGMMLTASEFTTGMYDFYSWNEAENSWHNQKNIAHSQEFQLFQSGAGYLVAYDTSYVRNFQGSFVQSDILLSNISKNHEGWHLLGNPFPHSISWGTGNWNLNNISTFAYKLDPSGSFYELVFPGNQLPARQGFWVKATQDGASLTIPVESSSKFLNEIPEYLNRTEILFQLSENKCLKSYFQLDDAANILFEENEDAAFLSPPDQNTPQIYLLDSDSNQMIFNRLPQLNPCRIPFCINNRSSEEISVEMSLANLPDSLDWFITNPTGSQISMPSREKKLNLLVSSHQKSEFVLQLVQLNPNHVELPENTISLDVNSQTIILQLEKNEHIINNQVLTENGDQVFFGKDNSIQLRVRAGLYFLITQTSQRRILHKIIL